MGPQLDNYSTTGTQIAASPANWQTCTHFCQWKPDHQQHTMPSFKRLTVLISAADIVLMHGASPLELGYILGKGYATHLAVLGQADRVKSAAGVLALLRVGLAVALRLCARQRHHLLLGQGKG